MRNIKEGDLYKILEVGGICFEIRYGYVSEEERRRGWEPDPIYPNFKEHPQYTSEGIPLVTAFQDACSQYLPKEGHGGECWCNDCIYFQKGSDGIGLCLCPLCRERGDID